MEVAAAPVVALTHVRVVDGTGAAAKADQTVIIRGTKIEAVGPAASVKVPRGAKVVDGTGHSVIPGLVGMHDHTFYTTHKRIVPLEQLYAWCERARGCERQLVQRRNPTTRASARTTPAR